MKRRILCFVLTMAMVLSMLVVLPAATVSAESDTIEVGTVAELAAIATANNDDHVDYSGKTVVLTADLDLSSFGNWVSIGNSSYPFKGSFDGQGHTISGMTRSGGTIGQNVGLFGVVSSPDGGSTTIQNFKLGGSITSSKGGENAGMVISAVKPSATGTTQVSISGIWSTVNFDASVAKMTGVGGILGTIAWCTSDYGVTVNIDSCRYSGTLNSPSAGSNDYGGILGYPKEAASPRTINITNCIFDGSIVLYGSSPDDNGGIVGYFKGNGGNSRQTNIYISNCIVAGKFEHKNTTSQTVTGYVVSEQSGSNTDYAVTNVYYCNDSDRHTGGAMGGWYGYMKGGSTDPTGITKNNVTAKTMTELKAMTSGFADDTKWHFGESTQLPVPEMIYTNFLSNPGIFDDMTKSEFTITSDEEMEEFANLVTAGTDFAGKTIKLGSNVALNTTVGYTGSGSNRRPFSGSFDGQGHTVTITQAVYNAEENNGGLFAFVRIPADGTITIKDVHVTGTISLTNNVAQKGWSSGLIGCLDAGKDGTGGTINIQNVWNTVRINCGNANASSYLGGFIGFLRHEDSLKQITINIDSCLWDGTFNSGPAMYHFGGFVGYTGNNKAGRQPTINITNSVAAGKFMSNVNEYNQQFGVLTSFLKGSFNDGATAKVTVNISDVISVTTATFAKPTGSGSKIGLIEEVDGTTELNLSNIYYKGFARSGMEGDFPVVAAGSATSSTNVEEKTQAELLTMSTSVFSDSSKWVDQSDEYYPCPAGIVNVFGSVPNTLYVEGTDINIGTDAAMANFADSINNGGKNYAGKTIHLTADVNLTTVIGDTNAAKYFSGNFNGHGHTVTITQTIANPDGNGGLFSMVRIPENSTLTFENVHLAGLITLTNSSTGKGYVGALISTVDAGTSGSGGTLDVKNVWSTTRINAGASNTWYALSGYIGFVRHASGLKPITVNFDSCLWDGIINAGPALEYTGAFLGHPGNQQSANRPLNLNITNSALAGTIMLNTAYTDDTGLLVGYLKGNGTNSSTCVITANFHDIAITGKFTTSKTLTKWCSLFQVSGTDVVDMDNFYYVNFTVDGKGDIPVYEGTATVTGSATVKTAAEMYAMSTSAFSDASKWTKQTGYNLCPAGIVSTFGAIPETLAVDLWEISDEIEIGTTAEFLTFRDKVNNGMTFAGKTITLTADIDLDGEDWTAIGVPGGTGSVGKAFRGTFDGDGHTISNLTTLLQPTSGDVDMKGGLFASLGDGAVVKNFYLTGTITIRNYSGGVGTDYFGSVANAVGGTVLIQNVHSSVNFNTSNHKNPDTGTWANAVRNVGGLVGFIFHRINTDLTIDGCTYSGTINPGNSAEDYAGIIAYTGSNESSGEQKSSKTVTITNSAFNGRMTINGSEAYLMKGIAGIIGRVAKYTTVNITGTHSAGKIYFNSSKDWPITDGENPIMMGQILGYNEDGSTVNIDDTVTYVPAKLKQVSGDDDSIYVLPEAGRLNGTYAADTAAVVGGMEASFEARNINDAYKGIRFKATFFTTASCTGGGTASANFGIYLLTKDTYEILGGASVSKDQLDAAGSTVVQVKATKFQNNTSNYVVSAVVFNLNTAARQETELVAIPYAGEMLGTAASTTYNAVFN